MNIMGISFVSVPLPGLEVLIEFFAFNILRFDCRFSPVAGIRGFDRQGLRFWESCPGFQSRCRD